MMDFITAPLVVGFICLGIYALFELFVRRKERLLIIEKISERMDIADLGKRLSLPSYSLPRFSFSSLKTEDMAGDKRFLQMSTASMGDIIVHR